MSLSTEGRIARLFEVPKRRAGMEATYYDAMRDNASLDGYGTHAPNCRCYWCSAEE